MTKKIFTLLLAVAASMGTMFAWNYERVQIGDLYYNLDATNHTAEVTSQNSSYPYWSTTITTANIPASVEYNSVTYSVTSIGASAFRGCSGLTSVTIGNSVTSIGGYAFYGCSGLTSVTIGNSVTSIGQYAFYGCWSLTSVTLNSNAIASKNYSSDSNIQNIFDTQVTEYIIGDDVTSIGDYAFRGCSGLTSVTIGNSVTSIGGYAFSDCNSLTSVTLNSNAIASKNYSSDSNIQNIFGSQVTEYIIGDDVTSIGDYAFRGCSGLTSVTIPNSVTSIGSYAFYGCSGLTSVTIPNSVTSIGGGAFYNCSGLTSIEIPNSVTSIGQQAFRGCSGLTSPVYNAHVFAFMPTSYSGAYTIPDGIESIAGSAFSGCSGLTSVTIPNSVTSIGDNAFAYCRGLTFVTIGNSVTSIGDRAFDNCWSLTSVTIPNSVTSIGESAFYGCSSLTKVNIMDIAAWCAISFGNYSANPLSYAHNLYLNETLVTDLVIPNSVTSIRNHAFYQCSGLTSVTIPNSVTSIGSSAFWRCTGLTSVTIPNSVTSMGGSAFSGCSGLTSVTIPNSVTSIGIYAFDGCTGLTSVTIPNSVTSIGKYAFRGCSGLTSVVWNAKNCADFGYNTAPFYNISSQITSFTFGNEVEHIPAYLCNDMSNLTSVTIPNSVTSIGSSAFQNCSGLTSVTIEAETPPALGDYALDGSDAQIYVPCGALDAYKTAWSEYASLIKYAPLPYEISTIAENGNVTTSDITTLTICDEPVVTCTATADYGYHFAQWSDGNTNNPRTIELTQDTTFTAEFAKNTYTITTESSNPQWGTTAGDNSALYLDEVEISATANYGYHFVKWNDNNTSNPRTISVTEDKTYTATFAKNVYTITLNNAEHGSISGGTSAEYLDEVTLTANPDYGYHFTQWSDGNTDNPRTIVLTQDTSFTAEFAKNTYTISTTSANPEWGTTAGDKSALYLDVVEITASSNYGYHFVKWNDNNTSNPRTISVTEDKTYTATFAKNVYTITLNNAEHGSISGDTSAEYLDQVTLTANPDYGYHFAQWSDGNTNNPRTIELTQDTTFTAEFAKNTYTISTISANPEWGITAGGKSALYLDEIEISAIPNYGYHFEQWSDGNTDNPRTFELLQDTTFTAEFAKNIYEVTKLCNSEQGSISGVSQAEYLDNVTLTAIPNYGYHFAQWSDGLTDNPRAIVLTQDTTFTAVFAIDITGVCGDDNMLTWTFDSISGTLAISGNGALNSNYTFGVQAPTQTARLIIEDGVTSVGDYAFKGMGSTITSVALPNSLTTIGDSAFAGLNNRKFNTLVLPNTIISIGTHAFDGASYIKTIHFGSVLEEIGDYAFNGCVRVQEMTCLAEITPNVGTDGIASISSLAKLYVPNDYLFEYQIDPNWSRFVLSPIGATETTVSDNDVTVSTDDNTATLTWPTSNTADSYTIEITKDGEVFCQLIFNANGQLTGIAFAPSRNDAQHAPAATMTANGMQFTVTGLNSNTQYGYCITTKDSNDQTVATYSGTFTTTGEIATGIDNIQGNEVQSKKFVRDGQIFILRGEKIYNAQGALVK